MTAEDSTIRVLEEFLNTPTDQKVITKKMISAESDSTLEDLIYMNINGSKNWDVTEESTNEDFKKAFYRFSVFQQAFYSTLLLERNVMHGGFKYYFDHFQSVGQFGNDASRGYKILGFPNISKIVDESIEIYENTSKESENRFAKLDTLFLQQIKFNSTTNFRIKLIRNNIDSFITQ